MDTWRKSWVLLGIGQKKKKILGWHLPNAYLPHQSAGILESQLISQHHARLWSHLGRDQIITCLCGTFVHLLKANVEARGGRWHSLGQFWVLNHIWVHVSGFSGQTETAIVWLASSGSSTMDSQGYEGIGVGGPLRTLIFLSYSRADLPSSWNCTLRQGPCSLSLIFFFHLSNLQNSFFFKSPCLPDETLPNEVFYSILYFKKKWGWMFIKLIFALMHFLHISCCGHNCFCKWLFSKMPDLFLIASVPAQFGSKLYLLFLLVL